MKTELVEFPNTNNVLLPGLLSEPGDGSDRILLYLHGNGSAGGFYSVELQNTLAGTMTENGISYLTFTNTGGHMIQKFDRLVDGVRERVTYGVAYELIKDCIYDIGGAVKFAKTRGYKHIYLLGSSTGANKICVYNYYKRENGVEKYVIQSAGDDSGLYFNEAGEEKFRQMLDKCRRKIRQGKGRELTGEFLYGSPISYQSMYDQIDPDGDYNIFPFYWILNNIKIMKKEPWREVKSITKPTLVIQGGGDEFCYGRTDECMRLIKTAVGEAENFSFEIVEGADHGFAGKQRELAERILKFLGK